MAARQYRYLHLDVFTDRRFGGNQLAVFPEAAGLPAETCQQIAREMNFSESTFVYERDDDRADVRMRIFTPYTEMPMAGHPVIGSTFALAKAGHIAPGRTEWTFGLNIGPLPVDLEWRAGELSFVWMTQRPPQFGPLFDRVDVIARAVGVSEDDIRSTKLPVQEVSCGVPFVLVPIASRQAVDGAVPDARALTDLGRQAGSSHFAVYLFTLDRGDGTDQAMVYSRMFAPEFGILEDPATGSASGPLGCYLVRHGVLARDRARDIMNLQGVRMGRPSWIRIAIETAGDTISRVKVGGAAVHVAEGSMTIESRES